MGAGGSIEAVPDMHVVIVGGGYGGLKLAVDLRKFKFCRVSLVDPKDAMVHSVGALRASVEKGFASKIFLPYEEAIGDSFVRGKAVGLDVESKTVTLEGGESLVYTHLVIATGTSSPFPGKIVSTHPGISKSDGIKVYEDYMEEVGKATKVVIVGGGAVGLEMAGEIRTELPNAEVTVVNAHDTLASARSKPAFQTNLRKAVADMGINLVLNDKVSNMDELALNKFQPGQKVVTASGKEMDADLVIPCVGTKILTEFCKDALGDEMTESGALRVDEYLRVRGHDAVFALGDVTDVAEEKMAYTAKLHADLLASNFVAAARGRALSKYKPAAFIMILPLGKNGGQAQIGGIQFGAFVSKNVKSKDLFTKQTWADVGLKAPN